MLRRGVSLRSKLLHMLSIDSCMHHHVMHEACKVYIYDFRATTSGTPQVVAASALAASASRAPPPPHMMNPSYAGHETPRTVKCSFAHMQVKVGEHIGSFGLQDGDVRLDNIRITSYGYTCSVHLAVNAVQNPVPNTFYLINVNDHLRGGEEAIDAFCRKALEEGSGIAIDTEGNETIVDTIQIATLISGEIGEVLVVQLGALKRGLEHRWIRSFVELLTQPRFPIYCDGLGATGGDDSGKVSKFLELAYGLPEDSCTGVDALSGSLCAGIKDLAIKMGFPFEMKRSNDECEKRGYGAIQNEGNAEGMKDWQRRLKCHQRQGKTPNSKEKKNALYQDSRHALFDTSDESLVDISRELHRFLRITVSKFSFQTRPLLTLEQATYAALDAWITLWGGIYGALRWQAQERP
jgi:hypothetical protein